VRKGEYLFRHALRPWSRQRCSLAAHPARQHPAHTIATATEQRPRGHLHPTGMANQLQFFFFFFFFLGILQCGVIEYRIVGVAKLLS
jgi:hypothetical protein